MLKQLTISNIVLIESLTLNFDDGLNVLTGETGAGKSSIISALRLVLGDRSDYSQIRKGSEKASVTAIFDIETHSDLITCLHNLGIDHNMDDPLIIKRELSSQGKSRSFVNHQLVQLSLLETIGKFLISHVHQHAYVELFSLNAHIESLDKFARLNLKPYQELWNHILRQKDILRELTSSLASKNSEKERLLNDINEIEKLNLQESEDEELFKLYTELINKKEALSSLSKISCTLFDGKFPLIPLLSKCSSELGNLSSTLKELEHVESTLSNVIVELKDVNETLNKLEYSLEFNESEFEKIEHRLSDIDSIKKKYGANLQEIIGYLQKSKARIIQIENDEVKILDLQEAIPQLEKEADKLAEELSRIRAFNAALLQDIITKEIKTLNMPNAIFSISLTQGARTFLGDDRIEFLFAPNQGEKMLSLKDCASGGEMSRVLLALKTCLAHVEKVSTLIFDEIDAHLGGVTATIMGEKIKTISASRQVVCITHLPQVAKLAKQHIQIVKVEKEGRTFTLANLLDEQTKGSEINRMLGVIT
jgi:DNA repair protein RecN (Recombination protein N)